MRVSHENREGFFLSFSELALQNSCGAVDLFPFARRSAKLNVYGRKFQVYEKTAELSYALEVGQKKVIELENHCLVLGFF